MEKGRAKARAVPGGHAAVLRPGTPTCRNELHAGAHVVSFLYVNPSNTASTSRVRVLS